MQTLARFMMRNRWWVIAAWIVFMIASNGISMALGGANYKDEFKLPHTETDTDSKLLKNARQGNQNGIVGILVVHALSGDLKNPPPAVSAAMVQVCKIGAEVVQVGS